MDCNGELLVVTAVAAAAMDRWWSVVTEAFDCI